MEKQIARTERAHFMCPRMHFGILLTLPGAYDAARARACLDALAGARPFLRAKMAMEGGELMYDVGGQSAVDIAEVSTEDELRAAYAAIGEEHWDVMRRGLMRVFFLPAAEGFRALFAAHHLLADGRALLDLCAAFADLYAGGAAPALAEERLIRGAEDLPTGSALRGMGAFLIRRANKQWKKENHAVSMDNYATFVADYGAKNPVGYALAAPDAQSFAAIKSACAEAGVSVNDYLTAKTALAFGAKKIVIAADVRGDCPRYQRGALGNYATAVSIVFKDRETDAIKKSRIARDVIARRLGDKRALMTVLSCYLMMDKTLLDATAIASLGGFESKAAAFVGQNMFGFLKRDGVSLTNLGKLDNQNIVEAVFIPPASPAMKVTVGALTVNGSMRLCASFAEESLTRETVTRALNEIAAV